MTSKPARTGRQIISVWINPVMIDAEREPGQSRSAVVRELVAEALSARAQARRIAARSAPYRKEPTE